MSRQRISLKDPLQSVVGIMSKTKKINVPEQPSDLIVIGAGASGLMAAVTAARMGCRVLVLEHNSSPAKKILATGNGRCNFTNAEQSMSYYHCSDGDFIVPALEGFTYHDCIRFFEGVGVLPKNQDGYVYPRSGQASAIRGALISEAERLHLGLMMDVGIREIQNKDGQFIIKTKTGDFFSESCILATGGKAAPKTGSDGSGYIYATKIGHQINTPLPALVPLISDADWLSLTSGVRCRAEVTAIIDNHEAASDLGELQMTDYGISGIPVFQISRFAVRALENKQDVAVRIDFVPEMDESELSGIVNKALLRESENMGMLSPEFLYGIVNSKISAMVTRKAACAKTYLSKMSMKERLVLQNSIVKQLKNTQIRIIGARSFESAQTTAGGVDVASVDPYTMESKLVPGLFFCGEVLDVDAACGGYNLHWAWASGYLAGKSSVEKMKLSMEQL